MLQISLGPFSDLPAFELQTIAQTVDDISMLGEAAQVLVQIFGVSIYYDGIDTCLASILCQLPAAVHCISATTSRLYRD